MKGFALIPALALAACATPHPLSGLRNQVHADAGGFSFAINYSQDVAEATRLTRVWRPDYGDVQAAAVAAVAKGTGCTPKPNSAAGDVALIRMKISCPDVPATPARTTTTCSGTGVPFDPDNGVFDIEFDCVREGA